MAEENSGEEKIDFEAEEAQTETEEGVKELGAGDFKGGDWLKIKPVGEELILEIEKVVKNRNTTGKSDTGSFDIGLKQKDGKVKRYDIHTKEGIFTVNSWEVYFKLFDNRKDKEGILIKYAKENKDSFKGAKVSLKRNANGNQARMNVDDLAKIRGCSVDEAKVYQEKVQTMMKEKKLYEVKLLN